MTEPVSPAGAARPARQYPGGRFVHLRIPSDSVARHHFTARAAEPGAAAPLPETHGVLADIAASDPGRARRVAARLGELIAREDVVLTWLEADPAHTARFLEDPATALREALPELPADFFAGWKA